MQKSLHDSLKREKKYVVAQNLLITKKIITL